MLETLKDLVERHPFVPFTGVLSCGDRHEVRYPATLSVGKQLAILIDSEWDRHHDLRVAQIADLDVAAPAG